jgi:hypothetical protein
MRQYTAQCTEFHSGRGNHVVHNAKQKLSLDKHLTRHQKVGVLGHSPGQSVFDGDDGRGDRSALDAVKDFDRAGTGNDRASREHPLRGFVAEGTELTLDGNFHE